jgi:ACS family tartrate transporter-like MFS transporter
MRKVSWRLIPFMMLLYFVAFLDRVNVGFAALTMNKDLALSATVFGNGAGIFFIGYFFLRYRATSFWRASPLRRPPASTSTTSRASQPAPNTSSNCAKPFSILL